MCVSGFFGKANISHIDIALDFPSEIYANTSIPLRVTLMNRRAMPAFLIKVKIDGIEVLFPFVDARSEENRYIDFTFIKRGTHTIEGAYAYSVFPFNFFVRTKKVKKEFDIIVFPELKKGGLCSFYEIRKDLRGELVSDSIGYESDMISIRKYVLGDPLKYINWKATAKTGELKTKELSALVFKPTLIDFDEVGIRDLEEKISRIAFILLQFLKENVPVGLRIKDRLHKPGLSQVHKIKMLTELALYSGTTGTKATIHFHDSEVKEP